VNNRATAEPGSEYRALFEHVSDGLLVLDPDTGTIRDANGRFVAMSGFDRDALVDARLGDLLAEGTRPDAPIRALVAAAGDDGQTVEWRVRRHGGEPFWGELSASLTTLDGERSVLTTVRDVTETREYQQVLEKRNERLELLNRIVRHDIRNDMQLVQGMADLLDDVSGDRGEPHLETIRTRTKHVIELTDLMGELMDVLVAESGESLEPTTLSFVLDREVREAESSYPDATIRTRGNVPLVEVVANDMLRSVFRNLLNNAVQHHDGDEPTVEVSADVEDEWVLVRVADDGPGIDPERREAVFGRGEKGLDSEGTGLGLYLVDTLVDNYGGEVWIEDNEPRGTVFNVRLRLA
jgi:PAS domain S-box-containing protein